MAPENADLLYHYGRTLYKVAIATSDVLGNKVAQSEKKKAKTGKAVKAEAAAEGANSGANGAQVEKEKEDTVASKPYFQLTGDENWTDSEDEEEGDAPEAGEEEDQDDFGIAFGVFDMARVLYTKQLQALEDEGTDAGKGKGKAEISPQGKLVRERLADCYNYLVDISFENESFHQAVPDARSALAIQQEFLDETHEYITEAHFKLSLALEFASVSKLRAEQADMEAGDASAKEPEEEIDYELRKEAAEQMELAIASLEGRIEKEEADLPNAADEKTTKLEASIKDSRDMLEDMKTRVCMLLGLLSGANYFSSPICGPTPRQSSTPRRGSILVYSLAS
jgi:HAT1-interacting factor 1